VNAASAFPLQVAGLTIDPVRRRISGPGGEIAVEPMVMRLFEQLLDRRGEVLSRRHLFDSLWGKAQVGDDSLNRLVASLRKALECTSNGTLAIETVPRSGYRLVVGSQDVQGGLPLSRRTTLVGGASLLVALGGAALWRVRTEVRTADARRLTDRGDDLLRDSVPLEAGVALAPLQASLKINANDSRTLGLLALAEETRAYNGGASNAGETLLAAEQAARAALARDPNEPHARLAIIDMKSGSLDWAQIEDQLEAVRALAPTNVHVLGSLATLLQGLGRTSRSWVYNERAAALAPASPTPQWRRALRLWTAGHTEEALTLTERLLPLWPTHAFVWNARFMILAFSSRAGAAIAMLRNPVAPARNSLPARIDQWQPTLEAFTNPTAANVAAARAANLKAAHLNPGQAAYAAMALSQLGEIDAAFDVINGLLLSKGPLVADRPIVPRSFLANSASWCRTHWLWMPPLAAVRRDPRFSATCEELGLASYWRQRGVGPDTRIPI
jgi:DNA-binding winged helix-turn-helix (wHTH) protein